MKKILYTAALAAALLGAGLMTSAAYDGSCGYAPRHRAYRDCPYAARYDGDRTADGYYRHGRAHHRADCPYRNGTVRSDGTDS